MKKERHEGGLIDMTAVDRQREWTRAAAASDRLKTPEPVVGAIRILV